MLCLLPDELIGEFCKRYVSERTGSTLATIIKERLQELRISAAQTPSFVDYLKTPEAREARATIIAQINAFKTYGTPLLSPERQEALLPLIEKNEKQLMMLVAESECERILKRLSKSCNPADRTLYSFIVTNRASVQISKRSLTGLEKIRAELEKMEKILNSSRVSHFHKNILKCVG